MIYMCTFMCLMFAYVRICFLICLFMFSINPYFFVSYVRLFFVYNQKMAKVC